MRSRVFWTSTLSIFALPSSIGRSVSSISKRRGLAGTVWPEYAKYFTVLDVETDAVDNPCVAVYFDEVLTDTISS